MESSIAAVFLVQFHSNSSDCSRHQANLIQLQPSEYRSQSDHLWSIRLLSDPSHTTSQYAALHWAMIYFTAYCVPHCTSSNNIALPELVKFWYLYVVPFICCTFTGPISFMKYLQAMAVCWPESWFVISMETQIVRQDDTHICHDDL